MPGGSGIDLLAKVKAALPGLPVIIMTAYSDLDSAVVGLPGRRLRIPAQALRRDQGGGADPPRASTRACARRCATSAAAQMPEMLGQAPAMQDVFRAIGRLSQSNVTVLITGESRLRQGTGGARAAQAQPARAAARSSPSTPRRSRRTCWNPNSSATSAAPSPARRPRGAAASSRPTAARCSSTRSATCRSTCRRACCACCRDGQFYRVGGHQPAARPTCASSPPRTRTWKSACKPGRVPRRPVPPPQRDPPAPAARCASGARTSRRWRATSCRRARRNWASRPSASPTRRSRS